MSTTEQQVSIPSGSLSVDTVHSSVGFEVPYLGVSAFSGTVKRFEASLTGGQLAGSAEIASLDVNDDNLLAHLLSPEFFDAERYPQVSFATSSASTSGEQVRFDGSVTIRGVTQPATLEGTLVGPVTDPYGRTRYGLQLETTIDRTSYGITWNADMPDGTKALSDFVTLKADLSFVQA